MLDVGSNTVHLLVMDAHYGAGPVPATSHKTQLLLAQSVDEDERISEGGVQRLIGAIDEAMEVARDARADDVVAFATSAIREARNGDEVLQRVRAATGVDLTVLAGTEEASLTFLAARRWFGWSAGRILLLDIGGGSLEIAAGTDEEPQVALSLPLGAGRLTRTRPMADPPTDSQVRGLEHHVRRELTALEPHREQLLPVDIAVATSKSFRTLARIGGAAPSQEGPLVPRRLRLRDLAGIRASVSSMTREEMLRLPAVSAARASQLLAAAVVAERSMATLGLEELVICPWALREGLILNRLDWLLANQSATSPP